MNVTTEELTAARDAAFGWLDAIGSFLAFPQINMIQPNTDESREFFTGFCIKKTKTLQAGLFCPKDFIGSVVDDFIARANNDFLRVRRIGYFRAITAHQETEYFRIAINDLCNEFFGAIDYPDWLREESPELFAEPSIESFREFLSEIRQCFPCEGESNERDESELDKSRIDRIADLYEEIRIEHIRATMKTRDGQNGPSKVNSFVWNGDEYRIQPTPWKLLDFMWERERELETEVEEEVWGAEADLTNSKLKTAMTRLNNVLESAKYDRRIARGSGYIFWKNFP